MHDSSYLNPQQLRGGWFVGPEEYESMGYTLGLPPGISLPYKPEIIELVNKLKTTSGIALPSMIRHDISESKRRVLACNISAGTSSESFQELIVTTLLKRKLITDEHPIEKMDFIPQKFSAIIDFKSQKDAEALVQLDKAITINNVMVSFLWIQDNPFASDDSAPIETKPISNPVYIQIPSVQITDEILKSLLEPDFPIKTTYIVTESDFAFVDLQNPETADKAAFSINNKYYVDTLIVAKVCFPQDEDWKNPNQSSILRMQTTAGLSNNYAIVNPNLLEEKSIPDILNPEIVAATPVSPQIENMQPLGGSVLCIYNIVKSMVLYEQDLVNEIRAEMEEECAKYGAINNVAIEQLPLRSEFAVVKIYYESPESAKKAQLALSGRRYAGRIVITSIEAE